MQIIMMELNVKKEKWRSYENFEGIAKWDGRGFGNSPLRRRP